MKTKKNKKMWDRCLYSALPKHTGKVLKKDRSQVKIQAPSGNVPYVSAQSYLSIH